MGLSELALAIKALAELDIKHLLLVIGIIFLWVRTASGARFIGRLPSKVIPDESLSPAQLYFRLVAHEEECAAINARLEEQVKGVNKRLDTIDQTIRDLWSKINEKNKQ